jgi:hypothetical protein
MSRDSEKKVPRMAEDEEVDWVAAMELYSADNGGHECCGVRTHEQGRRGRGRAGEGEWKARNGARRVP